MNRVTTIAIGAETHVCVYLSQSPAKRKSVDEVLLSSDHDQTNQYGGNSHFSGLHIIESRLVVAPGWQLCTFFTPSVGCAWTAKIGRRNFIPCGVTSRGETVLREVNLKQTISCSEQYRKCVTEQKKSTCTRAMEFTANNFKLEKIETLFHLGVTQK